MDEQDCTSRLDGLIAAWVARLHWAGVYNPEADVQRIIDTVMEVRAPALGMIIPYDKRQRIEAIVLRRERREPMARIMGYVEFCDLRFLTHDGVFRAYPETETVVDVVLDQFPNREAALRVLDVGTGSGCLLLSVLNAYPRASGVGIDINHRAIAAAQENAERLGLGGRAAFREGDWLTGLTERFDLLLSNPPRVPSLMTMHLLPEMRDHDPLAAVDGGPDGLAFFRRLADGFEQVCTTDGCGVFQVSDADAVCRIFARRTRAKVTVHGNFLGMPGCVKVMAGARPRNKKWQINSLFG